MSLRNAELTGNWMFLQEIEVVGFFRKHHLTRVSLFVEEKGTTTYYTGGHVDTEWTTRWRHGTAEDMLKLNIKARSDG